MAFMLCSATHMQKRMTTASPMASEASSARHISLCRDGSHSIGRFRKSM